MIIKSIRWRLRLWLGFLLICVLSGFGVAVYQLQRVNQLKQIDEELQPRLTESLLELARLDAGHEQCRRARLDLAEQTRACVERLGPLAAKRGLGIHCELSPAEASGDPDRLDRVVTNLLSNAIHYNKPNGEIRVATRAEAGAAVLTIADTGPGIATELIPHIFERFYRADKSRSRADGHFGLGLAICKAIVQAHGGSIEVSSRLGAGSTFTVRLPSPA